MATDRPRALSAREPRDSRYPWYPDGKPDEGFQHTGSTFYKIGYQSSHYVVNPEWVSERKSLPRFQVRHYKPWNYEYQGARTWPYHSVEERDAMDRYARRSMYPHHVPNTNYTQYGPGHSQYINNHTLIRRPDSAMGDGHLSSLDRDVLHQGTIIKLNDMGVGSRSRDQGHRSWATPRATPVVSFPAYTQQPYSTSYKEHYCKGETLSPEYAEYVDHEGIPPSRPRVFREPTPLGKAAAYPRGTITAYPPNHYQSAYERSKLPRHSSVSRPYSNFLSHNWVR